METKEEKPAGLVFNQGLIFALTACFYGFLHCTRSTWGLVVTALTGYTD
jgi:hypothetical protein